MVQTDTLSQLIFCIWCCKCLQRVGQSLHWHHIPCRQAEQEQHQWYSTTAQLCHACCLHTQRGLQCAFFAWGFPCCSCCGCYVLCLSWGGACGPYCHTLISKTAAVLLQQLSSPREYVYKHGVHAPACLLSANSHLRDHRRPTTWKCATVAVLPMVLSLPLAECLVTQRCLEPQMRTPADCSECSTCCSSSQLSCCCCCWQQACCAAGCSCAGSVVCI